MEKTIKDMLPPPKPFIRLNDGPIKVTTGYLLSLMKKTIEEIIPLFKVSKKELKKFKEPKIQRTINKYPSHPKHIPAHSSIDNFIYFPKEDPGRQENISSPDTMRHEVSHWIHHQLNEDITNQIKKFLLPGKGRPGTHNLMEIVAEYPNFILANRNYSEGLFNSYGNYLGIFKEYGSEFLPELSRMTLDEAIERKIILTRSPLDAF